jgi:hypothetical protein
MRAREKKIILSMERIRPIAQKSEIANRRRRRSSSSNSSDIRQTAVVGRRRTIANVVGRYSIIIIIIIIITILLLLCRCLPTGNCGVRMRRHRRRRLVPTHNDNNIVLCGEHTVPNNKQIILCATRSVYTVSVVPPI